MKTIHLIAIAGLMALATSCDPEQYCHNRNEGNVELLSAHKKTIPYKEGDGCDFIDKNGKVVRFVMTKKENNWVQRDIEVFGGYVDCSDYYMFEEDVITLKSESAGLEISEINFIRTIDYTKHEPSYSSPLRWDNNVCQVRLFLGQVTYYWNPNFRFKCNQDGAFITDSSSTFFHKTMKIGNQEYEDVVENRNGKDVLFYNQTYGILKVTQGKTDILTINR